MREAVPNAEPGTARSSTTVVLELLKAHGVFALRPMPKGIYYHGGVMNELHDMDNVRPEILMDMEELSDEQQLKAIEPDSPVDVWDKHDKESEKPVYDSRAGS